jgi:hypothetical protein
MLVTPDRVALKAAVRDRMLSLEEAELASAIEHYERFLADARLAEGESHDVDEIANARENADLAAAFDHPVHTHQAKISAIESLDFSPADTARPGAVVSFNNRHFVLAVSTMRFDVDGTTYMGISTQSPIYKVLEGLSAGDVFEHNGTEYVLDDVI